MFFKISLFGCLGILEPGSPPPSPGAPLIAHSLDFIAPLMFGKVNSLTYLIIHFPYSLATSSLLALMFLNLEVTL
jgi:hypothetical protein